MGSTALYLPQVESRISCIVSVLRAALQDTVLVGVSVRLEREGEELSRYGGGVLGESSWSFS